MPVMSLCEKFGFISSYCVDSMWECEGNRAVVVTRCLKTWQLRFTESVVCYVCCINFIPFPPRHGEMIHVQCYAMLLLSLGLLCTGKILKCKVILGLWQWYVKVSYRVGTASKKDRKRKVNIFVQRRGVKASVQAFTFPQSPPPKKL